MCKIDYSLLCPNCFEPTGAADPCPACGYTSKAFVSQLYLKPGTVLFGKYMVGQVLGQGGFGITYLGWDMNLDVKLAIKEFFPQGYVTREPGENCIVSFAGTAADEYTYGIERFLEEAKTLARFEDHPNIVSVRDFFRENNTAYMIMSFVEGITFERYLENQGGQIPFDRAVEILMPVMDALREVHEVGFMHRDISPDNIVMSKKGRVVLIDFGAAREEMRGKNKSLSVILKKGYAPEEQYRSRGKQGPWTDVYAVGATLYRAITGKIPPEAMDRLDEDDLVKPSEYGIEVDPVKEAVLLKAVAIKAKDRYRTMEEFQAELLGAKPETSPKVDYAKERVRKPTKSPAMAEKVEDSAAEGAKNNMALPDVEKFAPKAGRSPAADNAGNFERPAKAGEKDVQPADTAFFTNRKTLNIAAVVIVGFVILAGAISMFAGGEEATEPAGAAVEESAQEAVDSNGEYHNIDPTAVDPAVVAGLDADYYIDYENGTIPIGDLPVGARVVDPSWNWEYRLGGNYSDMDFNDDNMPPGEVKPVTWIVVAKDHYEGLEPHVTLLSEELIGLFAFDDSTDRTVEDGQSGYNHWGDSGTGNASHGLRPWLNSSDIHSEEGFYQAFSDNFKQVVVATNLPNRKWDDGSTYNTIDNIFIPSSTELNVENHESTYTIGNTYIYFTEVTDEERIALLVGDGWYETVVRWWGEDGLESRGIYGNNWYYWTRSPNSVSGLYVHFVSQTGELSLFMYASHLGVGVRPALNIKSETLVSEINK